MPDPSGSSSEDVLRRRNAEQLDAGAAQQEKLKAELDEKARDLQLKKDTAPRGRIHRDNLHELFTYHAPTGDAQPEQYKQIREAAFYFANAILALTPSCADQQAALRHVREAMMTANAAIALNGMC